MADSKVGARPGSIRDQAVDARLSWMQYDAAELQQGEWADFSSLARPDEQRVLWLDIVGTPGRAGLEAMQEAYGLHRMALEDVQNLNQLPKHEEFDGHVFDVFQIPSRQGSTLEFQQLSLFQAPGLVISIHTIPGLFDPVRDRLHANRGVIRGAGAHYLLYALVDVAVDLGFPLIDQFEADLLRLEERADDHVDLARDIYAVRRPLAPLLRQSQRQRDVVRQLMQRDEEYFTSVHNFFWRDCLDHAERYLDSILQLRESAADLLNTHLAMVSHRMNDVMKVLTVMSTIFIPLSFIVGLYGMNFDTESPWNLPELGWRFGYFYVWGLMSLIVAGLLLYFRRKRWF